MRARHSAVIVFAMEMQIIYKIKVGQKAEYDCGCRALQKDIPEVLEWQHKETYCFDIPSEMNTRTILSQRTFQFKVFTLLNVK